MGVFAERVREARERKGWTQKRLADEIGLKAEDSVGAWETRGVEPAVPTKRAVAQVLEVPYEWLIGDEQAKVSESEVRTYYQSALPLKRLPPRAYEVVYEYLRKLQAAGLSPADIEIAEEFLIDGAYNKINSREPGNKSEEELILDIRAAWLFVQDVAKRKGAKL